MGEFPADQLQKWQEWAGVIQKNTSSASSPLLHKCATRLRRALDRAESSENDCGYFYNKFMALREAALFARGEIEVYLDEIKEDGALVTKPEEVVRAIFEKYGIPGAVTGD